MIKIKVSKEAPQKKIEAKEAFNKKKGKKNKKKKGQCYYPFTTFVLQSSTMFFI